MHSDKGFDASVCYLYKSNRFYSKNCLKEFMLPSLPDLERNLDRTLVCHLQLCTWKYHPRQLVLLTILAWNVFVVFRNTKHGITCVLLIPKTTSKDFKSLINHQYLVAKLKPVNTHSPLSLNRIYSILLKTWVVKYKHNLHL